MRKLFVYPLALALWSAAVLAAPEPFTGRVVGVHDGDTLTVLRADKTQARIRLPEIDAPECGQPYSRKAKKALSELVFGKQVRVIPNGTSWDRIVGFVMVEGHASDVNGAMVLAGAAHVSPKYVRRPELWELQAKAQQERAGLWSLPASERLPPWEWRESHRPSRSCEQS